MPSFRLELYGPLRLVGLLRPHNTAQDNEGTCRDLAAQWHDYMTLRAEPTTVKNTLGVFGCMADGAMQFDYFCGAPSQAPLPQGFVMLELPLMRCAVFPYTEHVSGLRDFVRNIFSRHLPAAGLSLLPAGSGTPEFVERYWDDFDHSASAGGLDVLVPVQA
jgi:predicted transcriptional regulator YdeE